MTGVQTCALPISNNTRGDSTHGHQQMDNTEIRLIIFFAAKDQIPYDYTVEVRNRFKGLDLIDRVPEELWMEVHDII